jgi:D-alanyl-D-alanine carboxypeptidase
MFRLGAKLFARRGGAVLTVLLIAGLSVLWPDPASAKYASIVIDGHSGQVLHAANADTRNYPASLTKMMTLFMAFEALDEGRLKKNQKLKVSRRAAGQSPSKLGLRKGRTITVEQAIRALVIRSANDVAVVVAEALGGTEAKFARMMTARAKRLGMTRTTFANASGLPNRKQLSTARDMGRLAQALYFTFPHYYHYFALSKFRYGGRTYRTHNNLVKHYRGSDGLKTGYTRASGYNLVTSVERNGRRLIGVVFGGRTARSRDAHMVSLLDKAWPKVRSAKVITPQMKPAPVLVIDGSGSKERRVAVSNPAPVAPVAPPPVAATTNIAFAGPPPPAVPKLRPRDLLPTQIVPRSKPGTKPSVAIAAAEPAPKPATRQSEPRRINGQWAIQVGAYYDRASAAEAVDKATQKMPSLGEAAEEAIVLLKGRKRPIYRARLVGFSEREARAACRALKKKRVACLAIKQDKDAILAFVR